MGILNLTPDSFSDGGRFNKNNKSLKHVTEMILSGADIIDVGGESTRPGSKTVPPKIEWKRVKFVISRFKKKYKKTCLSFDTRKTDLMIKGIKHGVDLINDVSGFNYDVNSLKKLKKYNVSKVLHHMKGTPDSPQCGFSMAVSNVLKHLKVNFKGVNVLEDENLRQGVKEFSDWPTIPQLYVKKEFEGGCDIVKEMFEKGELKKLFEEKKLI